MVAAAYAGAVGSAISTMALIARAAKNLCENEETIVLRILYPFL
jgi:hypothetical protein